MLVPFEWLKEYVEIKESEEEIAELLTLAGLECTVSDRGILELDLTPNRADCLSVVGVAREVSAILGRAFSAPRGLLKDGFRTSFRVIIDSPLCRRYAGRIIKGVTIGESPLWLKRRLELSGLRSINNVVDVTNYVMLELGHPLHAFDLSTLKDETIRVDLIGTQKEFKTLDGQTRVLPSDALMIWDGQRPVAVAGIMGGYDTEVTDSTTEIFLESAYFEPVSIRRTSRKLGIRTESSLRFERGTDIEGLIYALDRAAALIAELCGGEVSERIDVYPYPIQKKTIKLKHSSIKQTLGTEISRDKVVQILTLLGFKVLQQTEEDLTVEVPTYRVDISMETDLIEEIARIHGYNEIPSIVPVADIRGEPVEDTESMVKHIRNIMLLSGFSEAINYSFMSPDVFELYRLPSSDYRRSTVELLNPIRKEENLLRTFLLPSLVESLKRNINKGILDVKLFEISRIFLNTRQDLPDERLTLGAIYCYRKGQRLWETDIEVYFLLKGIVEKIFYSLRVKEVGFAGSDEPFLHKGKSAAIIVDSTRAGYVGVLSPEVKESLDLGDVKEDIGVLEIDLLTLYNSQKQSKRFTPLPRYPYIQRDISVLVGKNKSVAEVLQVLKEYRSNIIEEVRLFDVYEGRGIPQDMRSIGISIIYRAKDRTLTDEEVDSVHHSLVNHLLQQVGGRLR